MKKLISYAALAVTALSVFTGCASSSKTEINVGVIKGPTGIGTVELMEKSEKGENGIVEFGKMSA